MICHKCGSDIPEESSFCNKCGERILHLGESTNVDNKKTHDSISEGEEQIESEKKITYEKINSKKSKTIIPVVLIICIIVSFIAYLKIVEHNNNLKKESMREEILQTFNEQNWNEAKTLIDSYRKQFSITKEIDSFYSKTNLNIKAESLFKTGMVQFENKDYISAYATFGQIDKDTILYSEAKEKQNEVAKIIIENSIVDAKKELSKKEYVKAFSYLRTVLQYEPNNEESISLQNKYEKQYDAEIKETAKIAAAEAKKKADEEAAKYAPKKIVDKNGKQIWKIYISDGSLHFSGTYRGSGNFIVKLSDDNQELLEVIANEIGDFISDKTISVPYEGWYYLEVFGSDGSWEYNWN